MLDQKTDSTPSLWSKMLEDQLSSKRDRIANVFVFGDPSSGKKKLLDGLKKYTSIDISDTKRATEEPLNNDLDKVYIMDFKFIHLRQLVEDEVDEIGKINFFIFNRKYNFIQDLLTKDMMQKMLLIFVVDLENPEGIEDSLNSWFEYVSLHVVPFFQQFEPDNLQELSLSYASILRKFSEFGIINPNAAKKVAQIDINPPNKSTPNINIIQEEKEEDLEKEDDKNDETNENKVSFTNSKPADEFRIPILVVGAKSDKIEDLSNNNLRDFVEFTLQKMTKRLNSILFTFSAFKDWNVDLLSQFILYSLFDKIPDNMTSLVETTDLKKMFVRSNNIDMDNLKKKYKNVRQFTFPKKKGNEVSQVPENTAEIKGINDFLSDVKNGIFSFAEETEASVFVNTNALSGFYQSSTGTSQIGDKSGLFSKPTDKIRNLLKQGN